MTDTPAEVAEAIKRSDEALADARDCDLMWVKVEPGDYDLIRAHINCLERQLAEARGELAAKDEADRLQFEACAQLAAQRERDGRALNAIRQRLHCTSYRLGEDIIDIIDAALKDRP